MDKLLHDERIISGNKYETAILYDGDGKYIFRKKGKTDEVVFSISEMRKMNGGILTHNHPNGTVFSPEDINMLRRGKLAEIRACNSKGAYVLRSTGEWHEDTPNFKSIRKEYWNCMNEIGKKYADIAAKEGKSILQYMKEMDEEGLLLFSRKYGLNFRGRLCDED